LLVVTEIVLFSIVASKTLV